MPVREVMTAYKERREGSVSKLSTFRDGFRILRTILRLAKEERPLAYFSLGGAVLALASVALAFPLLLTYLETGLVPRLPTAVLTSALMILAFLSLACGFILDSVAHGRREMKRLHYLTLPAPAAWAAPPAAISEDGEVSAAPQSHAI
jgi:hypothetical protein